MSRSSGEKSDQASPRQVSRRDFGRSIASATAAGTLGAALWPSTLDALAAAGPPALLSPAAAIVAAGVTGTPIRIGSNENPYGLGPAALAAAQASFTEANRYPFGATPHLVDRIAQAHGVSPDNVLISAGSGEILRAAAMVFTAPSRALVTASPTFETPGNTAEGNRAPVHRIRVQANGSLDLDAMAARAAGAGLFFVCNPNNPTGGLNSAESITRFVAQVRKTAPDAVVLVDEAYFEFVEDASYATAIPLTRTDPKVIVSRTFSKIHGMAGLRVGYAIGHPDTLAVMRREADDGAISGLSVAAALASLNDGEHLKKQAALNAETRAAARQAFEAAGYAVLPSQTNFLMVDVKRPVPAFQAECRAAGVHIARPFPPLATHARITIGTADEMRRALPVMLSLLQAPAKAVAALAEPVDWPRGC